MRGLIDDPGVKVNNPLAGFDVFVDLYGVIGDGPDR